MDDTAKERRRYPRLPLHRAAFVACESGEYSGALLDVSYRGALFEGLARTPDWAEQVSLVIPCSPDPDDAIRVYAEVAFRRGWRMGLFWPQIDAASIGKLRAMVESNSGSSRLLERSLISLIWPESARGAA
jgi:hypothetical protein